MKEFSEKEIEAIANCGNPKLIKSILLELLSVVKQLVKENMDLKERIKKLEGQVAKNSRNSSKPPSTDQNKPDDEIKKKSKRNSGGQVGHKGTNLKLKENPDKVIELLEHSCHECKDNDFKIERRQEINIQIKIIVTEYRAKIRRCSFGCDELNRNEFPRNVRSPVQYSEKIKGIITYLSQYQLIPFKRLSELLEDLFDLKSVSQGTIANATRYCSHQLIPVIESIRMQLIESKVINNDETGISVKGKRIWLHTASTKFLSMFYIHKKRGSEATDEMDILPHFKGRSVHDHWKSYYRYDCEHALCNAHHLRELTFLNEEEKQVWALKLKQFLRSVKRLVDYAKKKKRECLSAKILRKCEKRYEEILKAGFIESPRAVSKKPKRGREKQTKAYNMLRRLNNHKSEVLAFLNDFKVPFDNNQAERDIRMNKVRQKISGTFRGETSHEDYCRIRSYVSTLRKNGENVLNCLVNAFKGDPWFPKVVGS